MFFVTYIFFGESQLYNDNRRKRVNVQNLNVLKFALLGYLSQIRVELYEICSCKLLGSLRIQMQACCTKPDKKPGLESSQTKKGLRLGSMLTLRMKLNLFKTWTFANLIYSCHWLLPVPSVSDSGRVTRTQDLWCENRRAGDSISGSVSS